MTLTIPASIDDVTSAWLSEAMGHDVGTIEAEQIGVGIGVSSALYRMTLSSGEPSSVIVKLPALDPAAVFTSTIVRMYKREVRFFNDIARHSPIRVPVCHHAAVSDDDAQFVVVMEDLGDMRVVDQLKGMDITDAEQAVDELALWAAEWWNKADALAESGTTVSLADPIYPAILPSVFAEGWEILSKGLPVSKTMTAAAERWSATMPQFLQDLAESPNTLAHGDYRADNILFAPDGSVVLLDFQLIGTASGTYDLAYFVTQSLSPDVAANHEQALFARWTDGVRAAGVPAADLDRSWEDYRKAAVFCMAYPVIASRGMDLSDPRQYELLDCMSSRWERAMDQLSLMELL